MCTCEGRKEVEKEGRKGKEAGRKNLVEIVFKIIFHQHYNNAKCPINHATLILSWTLPFPEHLGEKRLLSEVGWVSEAEGKDELQDP